MDCIRRRWTDDQAGRGWLGAPPAFTLVELLVTSAVAGIVLLALTQFLRSINRIYTGMEYRSGTQLSIRAAMDVLTRDIRMAGLNSADPDRTGLSGAGNSSLWVRYGANGNGSWAVDRRYWYDPEHRQLEWQKRGGNSRPLTESSRIISLGFVYTLDNGSKKSAVPDASASGIRLVTIRICGNASPEGRSSPFCFNNTVAPRN